MIFPSKPNIAGPASWAFLTSAADGQKATMTTQLMRLYLAQEQRAMEQAHQQLAAGKGDLALEFAYRAGSYHANFQQAAETLAHLA